MRLGGRCRGPFVLRTGCFCGGLCCVQLSCLVLSSRFIVRSGCFVVVWIRSVDSVCGFGLWIRSVDSVCGFRGVQYLDCVSGVYDYGAPNLGHRNYLMY